MHSDQHQYHTQNSGPDTNVGGYQQTRSPSLPHTPSKRECNDVFFLLVFLAVIIMTVVFAVNWGGDMLDATQIEGYAENSGVKVLLKYIFTSGLIAIAISLVWILLMIVAGAVLIWVALGVIFILTVAAAYLLTKRAYDSGSDFYWWPAIIFGLLALLQVLYVCCIRHRIQFAAAHLRVAGNAVLRLPMTLVVAIVMVFVQIGWAYVWVLGALGLMFHQDFIKVVDGCSIEACDVDINTGAVIGVLCGMLLVYFWGSFVLKNVNGVTVAGTVAAWKNAANTPFITMGAWLRAVTLNLGSICFGSLMVAILETIATILNMLASLASRSGNCVAGCLLSCLSCIVRCIESWVEFFNRFAFTYVGCYGYSFVTASRHVWQLFRSKGWSAIVNDDLTGNVFFLGNLIVGALSAYIAIVMQDDDDNTKLAMFKHPDILIAVFAFVVGYSINSMFMTVIASAVTTVFVLWAEDPHGWQLTRPEHYEILHKAWLKIYPEEYNNGYGKQVGGDRV